MTLNERVAAVQIMQKFVRMSRVLLPVYANLIVKRRLSDTEQLKVKQITRVYDEFNANPDASQYLIGSDILYLIVKVWENLKNNTGDTPESHHIFRRFLFESDRLITTWNRQVLN